MSQTPFNTGGTTPYYLTTTGAQSASTSIATVSGTSAACANNSTCTLSNNSITYPVVIPSGTTGVTPVKIRNAALNTGMGSENETVNVNLGISGNSFAGTYSSTLTAAIVTGP